MDQMMHSPLDAAEKMGFTPSEVDELEIIDLPRSQQPEGFWVSKVHDLGKRQFPGMMCDMEAEMMEREKKRQASVERLMADGWVPPLDPGVEACLKKYKGVRLFGRPPPSESDEESGREDKPGSPTGQKHNPRRRQSLNGENRVHDQDGSLPPPRRRSARIAAMKRAAECSLSDTAPNKRRNRGRAAPKGKKETEVKQEPDRSSNDDGSNKPSAAQRNKNKSTRAPGLAGTRKGRAAGTDADAPDAPRRRGRPRKTK
jgi:hypothetical protein